VANPLSSTWSKHRRTIIIAAVAIVVLYVFTQRSGGPKTTEQELPASYVSKGRVLLVHANKNSKSPVPLVIVLSDDNTKTKVFESDSKVSALADQKHFALVYPELLNGTWTVGPTGADAQYLQDVISYMSHSWTNVDASRIYIWGLGEGARLALAVACANPTQFAAIGVVGQFEPAPGPDCASQVATDRDNSAAWDDRVSSRLWSFSSNKTRKT
jgi:polyhydroxybutyrate depolymerase